MENIVTSIRREKKEKSREFLFGNAKQTEDRETIKEKKNDEERHSFGQKGEKKKRIIQLSQRTSATSSRFLESIQSNS